jgi:hypothetical protein
MLPRAVYHVTLVAITATVVLPAGSFTSVSGMTRREPGLQIRTRTVDPAPECTISNDAKDAESYHSPPIACHVGTLVMGNG